MRRVFVVDDLAVICGNKATHGIRTHDLRFTKALLYH